MIWLAREHSVVARCCGLPLFGDDDALVPAGLVPTIALLIGVFIAFIRPQFVRSGLWLSYGCASAALFWLFAGERDLALLGGAGVIVFGTALLPTMAAEMTRTRLLGRAAACTMTVMAVGLRAAQTESTDSRAALLGVPMALIALHYLASGWQAAVEIAIQSPEKTTFLPRRELIGALVALTLLFAPTVFRLL
jgi:hypothetical protein